MGRPRPDRVRPPRARSRQRHLTSGIVRPIPCRYAVSRPIGPPNAACVSMPTMPHRRLPPVLNRFADTLRSRASRGWQYISDSLDPTHPPVEQSHPPVPSRTAGYIQPADSPIADCGDGMGHERPYRRERNAPALRARYAVGE
jgi:hypothetical protein